MKKWLTLLVAIFFFITASLAQDQHFTQYYASPLTLNPALTGAFDGKYRLAIVYRDQWRNVLDDPYVTFGGALDTRFKLNLRRRSQSKDAFGGGVQFFSDRVPSVDFSTNQIMVSGAFHKALNRNADRFLSVGVQLGISQRNVNYERLNFGDQFNGTSGYTDPTGEVLPENNFSYGDISVGLHYSSAPRRKTGFFIGGAIHHLTEPQVSFYIDRNDKDGTVFNGDNKLHRKYTAHFGVQIPVGDRVQVLPRAMAYMQGSHFAANAGTNLRLLVDDVSGTAVHVGGWVRPVRNEDDSFTLDAVVALVGLEFNNFLLGFSYDANLNYLGTNGRRQGAFEISLAFLGQYEDETVLCPKF